IGSGARPARDRAAARGRSRGAADARRRHRLRGHRPGAWRLGGRGQGASASRAKTADRRVASWREDMKITRDIIGDLLPAYLSGEASADTRALVDEAAAGDAEIARLVESARQARSEPVLQDPVVLPPN